MKFLREDNDDEISEIDRAIIARWGGHPILLSKGFLPVVRVFLLYASDLPPRGLNPTEVLFVLQLMLHKWDEANPYPSYERLAGRMGISVVQARKVARNLEERGFMRRIIRPMTTNEFDLSPLFERLALHTELAIRTTPPHLR